MIAFSSELHQKVDATVLQSGCKAEVENALPA